MFPIPITWKPGAKLGPVLRDECLSRYVAGESALSLSPIYGISYQAIIGLAKRRGISIHNGKLTPQQRDEIVRRYVAGEHPAKLGIEFGMSRNFAGELCRRRGIKTRGIWGTRERLPLDHNAFSALTPASAYWIGFLLADGNVSSSRPALSLALQTGDRSHILKFQRFLGATEHKITIGKPSRNRVTGKMSTGAAILSIQSEKIVADLAEWGVIPRKSLIAGVHHHLVSSHDFWRGLIDGDGSIGVYRSGNGMYPSITLTGSADVVSAFCDFVTQHNPACRVSPKPTGNVFSMSTKGSFAVKTIGVLYDEASIYLDRKMQAATDIIVATK